LVDGATSVRVVHGGKTMMAFPLFCGWTPIG
jgi:hypothetical protein